MSNIEIETSAKVQAYKERINELSTVVSKRDQQIKELQQRVGFLKFFGVFLLNFELGF
jgi:hypothetical protein